MEKDTVERQQNQQSTVFKCVALLLTAAALTAVHAVNCPCLSEMETALPSTTSSKGNKNLGTMRPTSQQALKTMNLRT